MLIFDEDRGSDSPFVERVWRCHSEGADPFLSIAASRRELVVSRLQGKVTVTMRGPETRATLIGDSPGDGEWLGIIFKLGTFMPQMTRSLKHFVGQTPAQILARSQPEQMSLLYKTTYTEIGHTVSV
jgi:hypothetical protein